MPRITPGLFQIYFQLTLRNILLSFFCLFHFLLLSKITYKIKSINPNLFQLILLVLLPINLESIFKPITLHIRQRTLFWYVHTQIFFHINTKEVADNQSLTTRLHNTRYLIENQLVTSCM